MDGAIDDVGAALVDGPGSVVTGASVVVVVVGTSVVVVLVVVGASVVVVVVVVVVVGVDWAVKALAGTTSHPLPIFH